LRTYVFYVFDIIAFKVSVCWEFIGINADICKKFEVVAIFKKHEII